MGEGGGSPKLHQFLGGVGHYLEREINGKTMDGFTKECRGPTPPNVFTPFCTSAIISYHSINSAIRL